MYYTIVDITVSYNFYANLNFHTCSLLEIRSTRIAAITSCKQPPYIVYDCRLWDVCSQVAMLAIYF